MSDDPIPTRWMVATVSWGEGKKHLCHHDDAITEFFKTREKAERRAHQLIHDGKHMVAVLHVKDVLECEINIKSHGSIA